MRHAAARASGKQKRSSCERVNCIKTMPLIEFNLACYASIQSYFEEVKARLQQAIELDQETRRMALDDPDLEPLWNWIKRE